MKSKTITNMPPTTAPQAPTNAKGRARQAAARGHLSEGQMAAQEKAKNRKARGKKG